MPRAESHLMGPWELSTSFLCSILNPVWGKALESSAPRSEPASGSSPHVLWSREGRLLSLGLVPSL